MKDIHCSGAFSVCILVSTWDLSWARAGPDKYDTSTSSVCWVTDGESVCWCISTTVTTQPNFITWQRILQRLSMQVVRSSQADCHDLFAWLLRALKAADCRTKSSGFVVNAVGRLRFRGTTSARRIYFCMHTIVISNEIKILAEVHCSMFTLHN